MVQLDSQAEIEAYAIRQAIDLLEPVIHLERALGLVAVVDPDVRERYEDAVTRIMELLNHATELERIYAS